jgi:hypothetical protein
MARQFSKGPANRGGTTATTKESGCEQAWYQRNVGSGIDQSDRKPPVDPMPGKGTTLGPNPAI